MLRNNLFQLISDRLFLLGRRMSSRLRERATIAENRAHLSRMKSCGSGVGIWGPCVIKGHRNITLGNNVHIGGGAYIQGEGGLEVGDNTHISRNLLLYTRNHDHEGARLPYDDTQVFKPVYIGRNVWIGMNVSIAPGTTIGDGAIIGMGTVVSGAVPAMAIVGSEKWRVLGWRDKEHYNILDTTHAYGGPDGTPFILNCAS